MENIEKHNCCGGKNIEKVKEIENIMPCDEEVYELSELFKVLGDYTRVNILFTLQKGEMCVCDIAEVLGMTQSAISHQLRVLKQARLVKYRREGKSVFYSLADEHVKKLFEICEEHIKESCDENNA